MRRVRYSDAATLDGFIADGGGGYDWIIMDESIDFAKGSTRRSFLPALALPA